MKKLFLTIAIISLTTLSYAQGTIAFGNSALTRITVYSEPGGTIRNVTAADGVTVSIWYGPEGSARDQLVAAPGVASIGSTTGVMINAPSVFALPGTSPNEVVSLQIRAEGNNLCGETAIRQVTLGQTAGPGAVIWQTGSGANPSRFTPLVLYPCPEPSTLALGALGGALLLLRLRKSSKPT